MSLGVDWLSVALLLTAAVLGAVCSALWMRLGVRRVQEAYRNIDRIS